MSQFRPANMVHTSYIKLVYYYTSPCAGHWRRNNNLQRLICMLVSTITLCARTAYFVCGVMNKGHLIKIMALLNVIQISRQRQIASHFAAPHCVKGKNDRTLFGRCDSINKFHLGARAGARIVFDARRQKLISRMTRRVLFLLFSSVSSSATFCSLRAPPA